MNENQEHEFPDELISAYLDGELSPAEKVRVEEQLMDSAEHRRLFDELKSLRRSLQSLPAESLGEDFAARVLRRAERELLADVASPEKPKVIEPLLAEPIAAATVVDEQVNLPPADAHSDRGARRGLVWSIAATAAAVGLVVFGPLFNEDSRTISQRPAEPVEMRAAPPAMPGETERAKNGADKAAERGVAENGAARASRGGVEHGDAQIGAAQAKREGEPPLDDANALLRARDAQVDDAEAPVEETSSGARYNASTHFENSRNAAPGARGEKDRAEEVAKPQAEEKAATTGADGKIVDDVRGGGKPTSAAEDRFGGAAATGVVASAPPALAAREPLQAAASAKLGLVTVDLRHDAFTAKYFDRLLERHDIQVEVAKQEDESDDLAAVDQVAQVPADGANDVENRALLAEAVEAETAEGASAKDDAADYKQKFAEAHEDVEVLYVVATQEQIDGLLLDLQAEHDEVLAMAYDGVNPAKKFEQAQAWLHRSRQLRGVSDFKELQELKEEARRASDNEELAQQFHAVKPASASPTESHEGGAVPAPLPADLSVDADRADVRLADGAKSSFARRLNLPQRSAKEADIPQGGGAGGASLADPARPDAASEVVADDAPDGDIERNLVPAEPAAIESPLPTADALGGSPAAPQAIRPIDGRDKLAKAKEQGLVRVLFVLRAVTPAPAVEASPAPAEAQK